MARQGLGQLNLGMIDRLRLGWRLLRDPRVPSWPKLLVPAITIIYVLSPVDAIPDFIPILGQLDDVGVIALALAMVGMLARWSPVEIVRQHAAALGLGDVAEAAPWSRRARGQASKDEPIEATYWVDDWK
jgi:uncharacterized membrane protein YkvA (DUF1232 family)